MDLPEVPAHHGPVTNNAEDRSMSQARTPVTTTFPSVAEPASETAGTTPTHFGGHRIRNFGPSAHRTPGHRETVDSGHLATSAPATDKASDTAQARAFLALLNTEIEDLSARIEAAVRLERHARRNTNLTTTSVARTDAIMLRKELHSVHRLVKQLTDRFPTL